MERRTRAHEDLQVQEYCSECGQPIPPAEPDEETQSLQWQASETESQAAVEQPPEWSQQDPRALAPPRPAAGGAAIRPTGRRTRSGPRLDVPPSGKPTPPPPTSHQAVVPKASTGGTAHHSRGDCRRCCRWFWCPSRRLTKFPRATRLGHISGNTAAPCRVRGSPSPERRLRLQTRCKRTRQYEPGQDVIAGPVDPRNRRSIGLLVIYSDPVRRAGSDF